MIGQHSRAQRFLPLSAAATTDSGGRVVSDNRQRSHRLELARAEEVHVLLLSFPASSVSDWTGVRVLWGVSFHVLPQSTPPPPGCHIGFVSSSRLGTQTRGPWSCLSSPPSCVPGLGVRVRPGAEGHGPVSQRGLDGQQPWREEDQRSVCALTSCGLSGGRLCGVARERSGLSPRVEFENS